MIELGRRYFFDGRHHLPQLAGTEWGEVHQHAYTVEVVCSVHSPMDVDTADIDAAWEMIRPQPQGYPVNMDKIYGAENTTVEWLAAHWLKRFRVRFLEVARVVVWEDDSRWASASVN